MEKLEWCGYQMVKKFKDIFIRFGATQERDGRTDEQTPGDGNSCAMHRSHGKNEYAWHVSVETTAVFTYYSSVVVDVTSSLMMTS